MLRKKTIVVNAKKSPAEYILKEGDCVSFFLHEKHFPDSSNSKEKFQNVNMKLDIVFENSSLIVLNKKAGILVHPDHKNYKNTLLEGIKAYLYRKGEYHPGDIFSPALCNRLDMNTSGLISVAKTHETLKKVTAEFKNRTTIKKYIGLAYGKIKKPYLISSIIDASENGQNKVTVNDLKLLEKIPEKIPFLEKNTKLSATFIKPLQYNEQITLLGIELWTGKKHQIRAQLAAAGHPLAGDKKYFTSASNKFSLNNHFKNYLLHSRCLKLDNYAEWQADPPAEFKQKTIDLLNFWI